MKRSRETFVQFDQGPPPTPLIRKPPDLEQLERLLRERLAQGEALREPPPQAPRAPIKPAPIAVFVAHGMGQQIPFETLDTVVHALHDAQLRAGFDPAPVKVRQLQYGDQRVPRAETTLRRSQGADQEVHLYEGYWAPLTEGRISLWETFVFLLGAAWTGIRNSRHPRWRMMFKKVVKLPLHYRTIGAFVLVVLVLFSLFLMNGVIVAATAHRVIAPALPHWPSGPLLADLTADFLVCLLLAGVMSLGVFLVNRARQSSDDGRVRVPGGAVVGFGWACVRTAVAGVVATAALVGAHLIRHGHGPTPAPRMWAGTWLNALVGGLANAHAPGWQLGLAILVWGGLAGASWSLRWFIRQYLGYVAIYVSAYTVNRFWETRQLIHQTIDCIILSIYEARGLDGGLLYDQVIVIGHSLGSVITYDAVNTMIRRDLMNGNPLRVVDRTTLLTSGSPLDKTAFLFRHQSKGMHDVREGLAQMMQPMISDYGTRPKRWINLWSPNDWVSGELEFYDDPASRDLRRVENIQDLQATTPLLAHNQYWDGETFGAILYRALVHAYVP